jgi:hypothetical protein
LVFRQVYRLLGRDEARAGDSDAGGAWNTEQQLNATEIATSPRCPAVPRPGPSIWKIAALWVRHCASLVTSREEPFVKKAMALNVAACPGATVLGPVSSIRATVMRGVNGAGWAGDRLSQAMNIATNPT